MDRKQRLLQYVNKEGWGVEIGPSYNPTAPKRDGYQVHSIDHLNQEQLVAKYSSHPVDVGNIEPVDFVWHGEAFAELTGRHKFYDWVIASHVIEHTPDMIRFLNNCDGILKEHGVLILAVPDRRCCFDYYRASAGLAAVIDAYYRGDTIQSPGHVADFFLNVVYQVGGDSWGYDDNRHLQFSYSLDRTVESIRRVVEQREYIDIHSWVFTPHSFRLILQDLYSLGFISLREIQFETTFHGEFFVTLGRTGKGSGLSRRELLEGAERDFYEGLPAPLRAPGTRRVA